MNLLTSLNTNLNTERRADIGEHQLESECCEFAIYPSMSNTIAVLPRQPGPDEMVVYKVTQMSARLEVVER